MNKTFNSQSSTKDATAFQRITPTIDYSNRVFSQLNCRVKSNSPNEKIITEEELLQTIWLS